MRRKGGKFDFTTPPLPSTSIPLKGSHRILNTAVMPPLLVNLLSSDQVRLKHHEK